MIVIITKHCSTLTNWAMKTHIMQRPWAWTTLKSRNFFFGLMCNCLNCNTTAMIISSFNFVNDLVCQIKKVNSRCHVPERLVGQRKAKWNNGDLCQTRWRKISVRGKSIDKSSLSFSLLALYIDHSDARTTKPVCPRHVTSPFWFGKQNHVT